jgi:hypothetical protein
MNSEHISVPKHFYLKQTVFLQEMSTDKGSFSISNLLVIAGDYQGK